jgi:ATP-dependent protease Clp ATPase subunit
MPLRRALSCRFCHKTEDQVDVLLAFTEDLCICDECVWLIIEIIAKDRPDWRDRIVEKLKGVEPNSPKR